MRFGEFVTVVHVPNTSCYMNVYKNSIRLNEWSFDLIADLEITRVDLNTYTFDTPYDGAGIIVTVYIEETKEWNQVTL